MSDPTGFLNDETDPWNMDFDIQEAQYELEHGPWAPESTEDPIFALEKAYSDSNQPQPDTGLTFQTPNPEISFAQDTNFASPRSRISPSRNALSEFPSNRTTSRVNLQISSPLQPQTYAHSPSLESICFCPLEAPAQSEHQGTLTYSRGTRVQVLRDPAKPLTPHLITNHPLDTSTELDPSQLFSSRDFQETTRRRTSGAHLSLRYQQSPSISRHESRISPSPRTPPRPSRGARSGVRRILDPEGRAASPYERPVPTKQALSPTEARMRSNRNEASSTQDCAMPSQERIAFELLKRKLRLFASQNKVIIDNIPFAQVDGLRRQANAEADKIRRLPPLPATMNPSTPPSRGSQSGNGPLHSTATPLSTTLTAITDPYLLSQGAEPQALAIDNCQQDQRESAYHAGIDELSQVDSSGIRALKTTRQKPPATDEGSNEVAINLELEEQANHIKSRLNVVIDNLNFAYAQRAVHDPSWQQIYSKMTQNFVTALFNLLAVATRLHRLMLHVWTVNDGVLLQLVTSVSLQLKVKLPHLTNAIRQWAGCLVDEELRWSAANRTRTMFFDSFSGLKAALVERDRLRRDGKPTFVECLNIDRIVVYSALRPGSDDELHARIAGELANSQRQTAAGVRQGFEQFDDMQQQVEQDLMRAQGWGSGSQEETAGGEEVATETYTENVDISH